MIGRLPRCSQPTSAPQWWHRGLVVPSRKLLPRLATCTALFSRNALTVQRMQKGDYGFNVFHNSNPQHGGSYARHERRMREDEVEDFMRSVKHWHPVHESIVGSDAVNTAQNMESSDDGAAQLPSSSTSITAAESPTPPKLRMGEEAIMRCFHFETFHEAYLFMGRLWAFCYGSDKYPPVRWEGTDITVFLYSASFRGLSKREARVAAFLNDHYNMAQKSRWQQRRIVDGIVRKAKVEEMLGEDVAADLTHRQALRTEPLQEIKDGPRSWRHAISSPVQCPEDGGSSISGADTRPRRAK